MTYPNSCRNLSATQYLCDEYCSESWIGISSSIYSAQPEHYCKWWVAWWRAPNAFTSGMALPPFWARLDVRV